MYEDGGKKQEQRRKEKHMSGEGGKERVDGGAR